MHKRFCGFLLCFYTIQSREAVNFRKMIKQVSVFSVFLIKFSNWHIIES